MRITERVGCCSPYGQVVRVQIFQGASRLGDDDVCILLHDRQRGPNGGNTSYKVAACVVLFGTSQGRFSGLQFVFDGGMSAAKEQRRGICDPQRWSGVQHRCWQRLQPLEYSDTRAPVLERHPASFDEALGALDVVRSRGMQKGIYLPAMDFIPLAGTTV